MQHFMEVPGGEDPDCGREPDSFTELLPEAMLTSEFDEEANRKNLNWCDVLVIGPGLGTEGSGKERMLWFLENGAKAGKPVILDADGLNILAMHPQWMNS